MTQDLEESAEEVQLEATAQTGPSTELPLHRSKRARVRGWRGWGVALVVGVLAFTGGRLSAAGPPGSTDELVTADAAETTSTSGDSLAEIITSAMDSIVSVETVSYGGPFGQQASGEGSGVVIRADGIILTNAHVIEGASDIKVTTADGERSLGATLVGADAEHDIAILQVSPDDLTPITIGNSEELQLGDSVVALGYPLGLGTTATQGIVSGLDRTIRVGDGPFDANELSGLLQTDAAINPGNSGGALLDSEGRLVGINTAAASAASAENIGFAVAIDEALPIIEQLLDNA